MSECCGACGATTDVAYRGWTDEGSPMPTCAECGSPPAPLSGPELRAACEAYLRENGWKQRDDVSRYWYDPETTFAVYREFTAALQEQWARDGIGGAT